MDQRTGLAAVLAALGAVTLLAIAKPGGAGGDQGDGWLHPWADCQGCPCRDCG